MNRTPIRILICGFAVAIAMAATAAPSELNDVAVPIPSEVADNVVSDPFVPDVYPSKEEAIRALGTHRKSESAVSNSATSDLEVSNDRVDAGTVTSGDRSVRFVEKPWLTDFAGFVTTNSKGRWIVGRTDPRRPATSAAEAARDARMSAVDEVSQLVLARLPERVRRRDDGKIREVVEASLVDGGKLVVDRFPQKFERPYGTVYREAVLIDASDAKLGPLADEAMGSIRQHRQSRARAFLGSGAVLLVVFGVYRLANAFTRGYFTWSLRATAALFAAGAVVILAAVL